MLRIGLFLGTNIAIMVVIGLVFNVLGIGGMLDANGVDLNLSGVLVVSLVVGFMGSFISLAMSKWMAKRSMKVQVIEHASSETEQWLVNTVAKQARQAGIGMPEVGIFNSSDPNAFATGMNKNAALVAVSTGLLQNMSRGEVEAVLAHEVSHVANGDMITMSLVQGVVNTFVYFLATVIGHIVDRVILKNERGHGIGYFVTQMIAQIVLSFLASAIVMWFSRWREFRADAGAAKLAGTDNMIAALERLKQAHEPSQMPTEMAAFGIRDGGLKRFFRSHPPLDERIEALRNAVRY